MISSVKLLVNEFCRHALDRAWYYYPDAIPEETLASEVRNGHIDCKLNFPVEDLYSDGQKAGQVGQEIYGAGAAMIYATRVFHRIEGAPFLLFCDNFVRAIHRLDGSTVNLKIDGHETTRARLALFPLESGGKPPAARLWSSEQEVLELKWKDGRYEAWVPANVTLLLGWEEAS